MRGFITSNEDTAGGPSTQVHTNASYVVDGLVGGLSCVRQALSGTRGGHVTQQLLGLLAEHGSRDDLALAFDDGK